MTEGTLGTLLGKRSDGACIENEPRKRRCYGDVIPETQETVTAGEASLPIAAPTLTSLSAPCILSIISRLSPEDLCSLAQTNRYFRVAASDCGIWRALFNHRWSSSSVSDYSRDADSLADGTFNTTSRWKEMYLHRDGAEVAAEARRAPGEEGQEMFLAMATARRSEPLSPKAAAEINPLLGTALAERVAAFRRIRGLHNTNNNSTQEQTTQLLASPATAAVTQLLPLSASRTPPTTSSAPTNDGIHCYEGCSFVELETNYWICEKGGHVHICGDVCTARHVDNSEMLVCSLTGRCFPRLMSEWEESRGRGGGAGGEEGDGGARDGEDPSGNDWNEITGMGGRLGRAFFAGYNATEKELNEQFGIRM
jgi:hypothetical protein